MSTSATHNAIMKAGGKDRAPMLVAGSYMMDHPAKKLLRFIQLNLQDVVCRHIPEKQELIDAEAETVHVILTGIDNDIYSTVDACANAKEMWLAIERLMQGKNTNKQDVETKLFWEFGKFTSQDGESLESYYFRFYKLMNELVRNKCELKHEVVSDDEDTSRDKEIAKLVTLISTSFKKSTTNNNLRTSSDTGNKNVNNTLRTSGYARQNMQYENQRAMNVAGNRDTLARECISAKRVKDSSYHKDKKLLCKQEEAGIQLSTKQHDWVLDSDEEPIDQELEAHYLYMAKIQEVIPAADEGTRPVFDKEPLEQVLTNDDYNVFAMENEHPEKLKSIKDTYVMEQCDSNTTPDSSNISNNGGEADQDELKFQEERALIDSLIEQMKLIINESKKINKC
ncbi:hypothetical protein Tco_0019598 [Tanacetum coccineum]